jgi:hypothetical protein
MNATLQTDEQLQTTLTEQQDQVDSSDEQALDPNRSGTKSAPKQRRGRRQQQPTKDRQDSVIRTMRTLQLWAKSLGLSCAKDAISLTFPDISRDQLQQHLCGLAEIEPDAVALAALMPNKCSERFDNYVQPVLLDKANSESRLDIEGAIAAARRTLDKAGEIRARALAPSSTS